MEQQEVIKKFEDWINQRPGLDFVNYGNYTAIKQEYKHIADQKKRANNALTLFSKLPFDFEVLRMSLEHSFSGRLSLDSNNNLDYTPGQYWPTEYRLAAAVVLEDYIHRITRTSKETALECLKLMVSDQYRWNVDLFLTRCFEIASVYASKLDDVDTVEDLTEWSKKREQVLDAIESRLYKLGFKRGSMSVSIFYNYLFFFRKCGKDE